MRLAEIGYDPEADLDEDEADQVPTPLASPTLS